IVLHSTYHLRYFRHLFLPSFCAVLLRFPIFFFFFFTATAPTEIYTLSLHDALPISEYGDERDTGMRVFLERVSPLTNARRIKKRSEEHTSELQSRRDLVCRLLLEKKKKTKKDKKTKSEKDDNKFTSLIAHRRQNIQA